MPKRTWFIRLGTGACFDFEGSTMEMTSNGAVFKNEEGEIVYVVRDFLTIQLTKPKLEPNLSVMNTSGAAASVPPGEVGLPGAS